MWPPSVRYAMTDTSHSTNEGVRQWQADSGERLGEADDDDDRAGALPVSRRQILAAGGVGGAGLLAYALLGSAEEPERDRDDDEDDEPGDHQPYAVWEEVRAAVQASPDHLPAQAATLVEAGDPEAVFEFVRDDIVTLPAGLFGAGRWSINEVVRWGAKGTLRGGAGTPREKAELLADLYTEMGYEAELVEGRTPLSTEDIKGLFFRPVDHEFDPDADEAQIRTWLGTLGLDTAEDDAVALLDEDGEDSAALGAQLFDALPEDSPFLDEFDWRMDTDLPVVRFRGPEDDSDRYANLFADVPFGEHGTTRMDDIVEASAPEVSVTLSAARASDPDPDERMELVSGTWNAEDIVGRQVVVRTLPGVDPLQNPMVKFSDIGTFVPSLSVQGGDVDQATSEELSVLGDAVTKGGDRFTVDDDGTVSRNGKPLASTGDAEAASRVESISLTPDVSRYPEIRLAMDARDADGDRVEGLPANAVGLTEEGTPAAVTLQSNESTPRVSVLYDTSSSMPGDYSGAAMQAFVETLTDEISAVDPDAAVDLVRTSSHIWTAAADAAATDANVVVYATDGDVADEKTPEIEQVLRSGPPVVMLSVNNEENVTVESALEIADLSGGVAVPARDQAATLDAVRSFVSDIAADIDPYQLQYSTPVEGQAGETHTVLVTVGGATSEATYVVPARAQTPPRLSSLWLTVRVGGRETTRLLAGYDPVLDRNTGVTAEMLAAVEGALFGSTTLTFEGGAPSLSILLDDFLAAKGSTAEMDAALASGDQNAIDEATAAGFESVPPEAFLLTPPLPDAVSEDSITYPDAIRVAALTHHPVFDSDESRLSGDILPLTRYTTVTAEEDPLERFRLTMERTARLAIAEASGFERSTVSLLGETPLVPFGETDREAWGRAYHNRFDDFIDTTGYRNASRITHRIGALVPEDGSVMAYWSVDRETGSVLGVLPNGTNGGASNPRHEAILQRLSRVVSMINLLAMATGAGGLALGVVAQYGQVLARLYAAVSMAIEMMDASALPEAIAAAKAELVCRIARRTFLEVVPMGKAFRAVSNLMNVVTGSTPASCG